MPDHCLNFFVSYKKGLFAVQADGFSMNKAKIGKAKKGIDPGDYVIVDADVKAPEDGRYVLSVIDGLANIKKFYLDQEHRQVMLVSESTKEYPPICIAESEIDQYVLSGKPGVHPHLHVCGVCGEGNQSATDQELPGRCQEGWLAGVLANVLFHWTTHEGSGRRALHASVCSQNEIV